MHDVPDTVSTLSELLDAVRDAESRFRVCAELVRSPRLKLMFEDRAVAWRASAAQLRAHLQELGGSLDAGRAVGGAAPVARDALAGRSDRALIGECERIEHAALEAYADALSEELLPGIRRLVEQHYESVRRSLTQLRRLLDTANGA